MRKLPEGDSGLVRSRALAPDWLNFDADLIDRLGMKCVARRSNIDLADDILEPYVRIARNREIPAIDVVTCDPTLPAQFGFSATCSVQAVSEALDSVYGLPFLLFAESGDLPILLVTDVDYMLAAGQEQDLVALFGDLRVLREDFEKDVWDPRPENREILRRALATMAWLEE